MRLSTVKSKSTTLAGCCLTAVMAIGLYANLGLANDGITSDAIINRAGLTVEWFTHTGVGASGRLVDWTLKVDENSSTTYFTVTAGKYREKFSENTISPFGRPYGIDGAEEYAAVRVDVIKAELANDGITDVEVKADKYTLPQTTIYALTSNAVVRAIDGDSGETKWSTQIGDPRLPSIGVGASNELVAAVNGTTLYCLEASTGKVLWTVKSRYPASASPTVSDERIFVPLLDGRLEVFGIADKGINSFTFVSKGRGTAKAVATEKTVAWPTSNGRLSVAAKYGPNQGVAYQLQADKAIVSSPVFKEGMFFISSLDGFVYAVDEEKGSIVWQVSTGQSISQSPIPLGNYLFVINNNKQMYKFDAKTGFDAPGWEEPLDGISRFVGASANQIYVLDRFGKLLVLSQDSGITISSVMVEGVQNVLRNLQTDRLYMVTDRGMIQCIRELGSAVPYFHSNEFVAETVGAKQDATDKTDSGQPKAMDADLDDPFKSATPDDNPFGGGAKPANDAGNPFDNTDGKNAGGGNSAPDDDDPFK